MMILQQTEKQVFLKCSASKKKNYHLEADMTFCASVVRPWIMKGFVDLRVIEEFAFLISFNCFRAKMSSWHGI